MWEIETSFGSKITCTQACEGMCRCDVCTYLVEVATCVYTLGTHNKQIGCSGMQVMSHFPAILEVYSRTLDPNLAQCYRNYNFYKDYM